MGTMKTPGVYVVEKSAFPNSVVEVATAVPAFIGHTEKAVNGNKSLLNKPWRITSMAEFHSYFGGGPTPQFSINEMGEEDKGAPDFVSGEKKYLLKQESGRNILYNSILMFYSNGGGPCYIVSVGDYSTDLEAGNFTSGVDQLVREQEPTMVVIPETTLLDADNSQAVQQAMLSHCGYKMKNRFAILDIWEGFRDRKDPEGDRVLDFRNRIGTNFLDFGAAYYPWVNTSIVQDKDLGYGNIANKDVLQAILKEELIPEGSEIDETKKAEIEEKITDIANDALKGVDKELLNKTLIQVSPMFNTILKEIKDQLNLLPPGAAMAGIYTMVDNTRGVWKAPANVSMNAVVSPALNITHDDQEELNVPLNGKSINAIRPFVGEGTLVWGARTLDGNSLDWRYINVRRTLIMLEESIKIASKAYVFEPNVANTWVTMKSMISNFLTGIWKRGGLAGASPDDAYSVHVGLGETMTSEDILEGILRVTVLVAVTRPAEFIEITFQQQMQKS
ncbi:phage tail sheath family protein [Marinilabiliaceae bacterium JC017]|nr:phage tail sheath family protein [Marinilabiliaceae bacterium JC017]